MKLLLYCTKQKPYLFDHFKTKFFTNKKEIYANSKALSLNGEIVAECDFEVDTIVMQKGADDKIRGNNGFMGYGIISKNHSFSWYDENKTCLLEEELFKYLEGFEKPYLIPSNYKCKNGYAIHIKNLNIFDKPRLTQYYFIYQKDMKMKYVLHIFKGKFVKLIEKAPQNMMYCYGINTGEKYILISIRPEWLCKILNGEKTIEVRKKVLKEML